MKVSKTVVLYLHYSPLNVQKEQYRLVCKLKILKIIYLNYLVYLIYIFGSLWSFRLVLIITIVDWF